MSGKYVYVRGEPYYSAGGPNDILADVVRARQTFLRAQPRKFPAFTPGMSTGMYIARFRDLNPTANRDLRGAAWVLPYDDDAYRRAAPVPLPDEDNPTNGA